VLVLQAGEDRRDAVEGLVVLFVLHQRRQRLPVVVDRGEELGEPLLLGPRRRLEVGLAADLTDVALLIVRGPAVGTAGGERRREHWELVPVHLVAEPFDRRRELCRVERERLQVELAPDTAAVRDAGIGPTSSTWLFDRPPEACGVDDICPPSICSTSPSGQSIATSSPPSSSPSVVVRGSSSVIVISVGEHRVTSRGGRSRRSTRGRRSRWGHATRSRERQICRREPHPGTAATPHG